MGTLDLIVVIAGLALAGIVFYLIAKRNDAATRTTRTVLKVLASLIGLAIFLVFIVRFISDMRTQ
jgi:RHS repeat-associated protein